MHLPFVRQVQKRKTSRTPQFAVLKRYLGQQGRRCPCSKFFVARALLLEVLRPYLALLRMGSILLAQRSE